MLITPQWVGTFQTGVQTLLSRHSESTTKNLNWDKLCSVKSSTTLVELYFFLIETMRLDKEGRGGQQRYEDIAATAIEIVNENSGSALQLTRNEIEDNQMREPRGMPVLDFTGAWTKGVANLAMRWPQDQLFALLAQGNTAKAYDNLSFWNTAHLINPKRAATGTYANVFTGAAAGIYPGALPIDESVSLDVAISNFSKALAYVEALTGPDGKPRNAVVKYAAVGTSLKTRINQILDTKLQSNTTIENVVSRYGIEPIVFPEISLTDKSCKLICEFDDTEGGPLIFQNREDYALTMYDVDAFPELARRDSFEWRFRGRNAMAFGHPHKMFEMRAT